MSYLDVVDEFIKESEEVAVEEEAIEEGLLDALHAKLLQQAGA